MLMGQVVKGWISILLLLATLPFVVRQGPAETTDFSLRHQVLTTWTTDQGLPQNFVRAIAQTSDGLLWVGTMNGLVRFDGIRFRGFSKDGPPELQDNIGGLAPDAGDGLWVATATELFHYSHQQFQSIPLLGQSNYRLQAMARGFDGEVWIYAGGKLARTRNNALEVRNIPAGAHPLRDLAESANHTLWIADGESVFAARGAAVTRYLLPGANMVYADISGDVFAGDGHRLFRFDGQGFAQIPNPGLGNFVSVLIDHRNRLWMASGGLHGLSRKSESDTETLTTADGLASDDVRLIFEDRNHDIWLGTISGLQRLHQGVFVTYRVADDLPNNHSQVDAVFQQKDGSIWAGTLEGGIAQLSQGRWKSFGDSAGLPPGQVRGFIQDSTSPAIAISDYGIFTRIGDRFSRIPSIPHGYINTPVRTPDGSLWFGVEHQGLYCLKGTQLFHPDASDGLPGNEISSLAVDAAGVLWVGASDRLLRWNQTRFETVLTSPSPVLAIAWPGSGDMVLGTLHGLFVRTGQSSRMLTQQEGLPGNTVLDVLGDDAGNLWIATTLAIARLSQEQWRTFAEGKMNRVNPQVFTSADGLRNSSVLPLNQVTAMRAQDGRIWFATAGGLSVVDPTLHSEPPVPAILDSIMVDDREHPASNIVVAPGQHRVTFIYTAPPVAAPEQITFRYRLLGWDHDWIHAGSAREVSYTGLHPGSYTFEVMAVNREGLPSATPAAVVMHLRPFFWQTEWFLVLAICLAASLLIEITRRRTRLNVERMSLRLQERMAERERIAYEIHDTVIQDMTGATLQLELLGFHVADQPEKALELQESLAQRMRETVARSRNMVRNLHSTAVMQYSLVDVLRHAESEFRLADMPLFELTSVGEARPVNPLVRDEVYRICREALANAFRHANARMVRVTVRFLPKVLEVEISDDGDGMDDETLLRGRAGHFGLPGMKAHAHRIGADIAIESNREFGTKIVLRVATQRPRRLWWRNGWRFSSERISDDDTYDK
jgi:signal transduction histidine kinase/ligand-binding sensor domain-containing protein